jgi:flagellar hook-length control protein FliK
MSTAIPAAATAPTSTIDAATTTASSAKPVKPANLKQTSDDAADTADKEFSALFSDVLQDAKPDVTAATPLVTSQDAPATTAQPVAGDGNNLPPSVPFVAWSGTLAVGDDQGASALALQGDNSSVAIGKPVSATDIPTAIQAAIQQQPQTSANAATTAAATGMTNWWNKLDNPQPTLVPATLAALGNDATPGPTNHADANALTALVAATASASPTTNNSALSYVQTARYDQPLGSIPMPVTHPDWGNQLGDGVRWMAQQNIQMADIRLNPPDMGLLEVRIQMNADQANVTFSSPHAAVRDAIEQALPRLRDMLGNTGIQLGDVNVSQQSLSQHQSHAEQFAKSAGNGGHTANGEADSNSITEIPAIQLPRYGQGLLDLYA